MTDLDVRPEQPEPIEPGKTSLLHRLYHGETHFDFVGKRRIGFMISGVLILISLLSLFTRGLNLGIEFDGGVAWEVPAANTSVDETRSTLERFGVSDAKIQTLRGSGGERIRAQAGPQTGATSSGVRQALAENAEVDLGDVSFTSIGPTWGDEITRKGTPGARLLLPGDHALHHDPLRVAHGCRRTRRCRPRRHHQRRRLLGVRLRGEPGDGHRVPHDPRFLALRHHRGVRQGAREQPSHPGHGPRHVRRCREPEHEPGDGPLAQHLDLRGVAGAVAAHRGVDHDGRDGAAGVLAGASRRSDHRCVLLDLHRHADPRGAEGARASVPRVEGTVRQHHGPVDAAGRDQRWRRWALPPRPFARQSAAASPAPGSAPAASPGTALGHPPRPRKKKKR